MKSPRWKKRPFQPSTAPIFSSGPEKTTPGFVEHFKAGETDIRGSVAHDRLAAAGVVFQVVEEDLGGGRRGAGRNRLACGRRAAIPIRGGIAPRAAERLRKSHRVVRVGAGACHGSVSFVGGRVLAWSIACRHNAESGGHDPVLRRVAETVGRAAESASAFHAPPRKTRSLPVAGPVGSICRIGLPGVHRDPVLAPFPDVAVHIVEPPSVFLLLADFVGLVAAVGEKPARSSQVVFAVAAVEAGLGSGPASILPLHSVGSAALRRLRQACDSGPG